MYVLSIISPFGWLFKSMLPALLSKLSSESEQGQVQGAFGATCSLAFAIGPVSWGAFCAWHLRSKPAHVMYLPPAHGLCAAAVQTIG